METIKFEIVMENDKKMVGELYPEVAPKSVENFVKLINENFFDGIIFHRVIAGFMIQGGGFTVDGRHKEADSIVGEFASNGIANDLKHTRGVLSMARTMVKNSGSSQFFIMHQNAPHLDGEYAGFGKIVEGLEVVDEIAASKTDYSDKPIVDCVIKTMNLI